MTEEKKDWQASLKLAKEALTKIDKEKYPKRYKIQEELVDTLQYNDNMRVRAEKAEEKVKASLENKTPKNELEKETPIKPTETTTPKNDFSLSDIRALNDVHDDDVNTVVDWAKFKKISIAEAKKTSEIQTLLREKTEERKTATATNTGGGRRGQSKVSSNELLKKLKSSGELPESDEDIEKLAEASIKEKYSR